MEKVDEPPAGERQAAVPVAGQPDARRIEENLDTAAGIEGADERADINLPRTVVNHGDLHRLGAGGLGEHRRE